MKKTLAFYLTAVATILSVVAFIFYNISGVTMTYIKLLGILAVVAGVAYLALYNKFADNKWFAYVITVAALGAIGAVAFSFIVEVEALGYLMSGLRQWSDVANWFYFAICGLVAWLLFVIASFVKEPQKA